MKLILVRHGRSEGNQYGLVQGHLDFQLSDEGRLQAGRSALEIKRLLRKERLVIFSSDLSRAWETAVIISEELGLPLPIPDSRLRERNFGSAQSQHWTRVDWSDANSLRPSIAGLETRQEVIDRVQDFLIYILTNSTVAPDATIAVTHGGTLAFIYHFLLDIPMEETRKLHLSNATIHLFNLAIKNGRPAVLESQIKPP